MNKEKNFPKIKQLLPENKVIVATKTANKTKNVLVVLPYNEFDYSLLSIISSFFEQLNSNLVTFDIIFCVSKDSFFFSKDIDLVISMDTINVSNFDCPILIIPYLRIPLLEGYIRRINTRTNVSCVYGIEIPKTFQSSFNEVTLNQSFLVNGNFISLVRVLTCNPKDYKSDEQLSDTVVAFKNNYYLCALDFLNDSFPMNHSKRRKWQEEIGMSVNIGNEYIVELIYGLVGYDI